MNASDLPPIKTLVDKGMPADAARILRDAGLECMHVSELGMQRAGDEDILEFAGRFGWIVVTLDGDSCTYSSPGSERPVGGETPSP